MSLSELLFPQPLHVRAMHTMGIKRTPSPRHTECLIGLILAPSTLALIKAVSPGIMMNSFTNIIVK